MRMGVWWKLGGAHPRLANRPPEGPRARVSSPVAGVGPVRKSSELRSEVRGRGLRLGDSDFSVQRLLVMGA